MGHRVEVDPLGPKEVPEEALYGVQTQRALENFPISGMKPHPYLVRATVLIKKAAALTNMETGRLDLRLGRAIVAAADEILSGRWLDQFVVDPFQAGAGTSHNMNVNEVLANRANELLGGKRGVYHPVHPNDHVNMAQSTNDVFPSSMKLAALMALSELYSSFEGLVAAFETKAREFDHVIKAGRTHLQDAVPIRLGQEFGAYALSVRRGLGKLRTAADSLLELNLGATAVGTGMLAEPAYIERVPQVLSQLTGFPFRRAENLVQATQSMGPFVEVSAGLRYLAVELSKICNDLRLMSSGPHTGLAEINLPAVQPGSSIMPGKVNPVIAEMTNMVCFQVMGNDVAIAKASEAGQLELNVMMPGIAFALMLSIDLLTGAARTLDKRCVRGITANEARCRYYVENSAGLATALSPYIGYSLAAEVAKEFVNTGKPIRQIVLERGLMSAEELDRILSPWAMTEPGIPGRNLPPEGQEQG
jgi:aspartate ammonia-lyase